MLDKYLTTFNKINEKDVLNEVDKPYPLNVQKQLDKLDIPYQLKLAIKIYLGELTECEKYLVDEGVYNCVPSDICIIINPDNIKLCVSIDPESFRDVLIAVGLEYNSDIDINAAEKLISHYIKDNENILNFIKAMKFIIYYKYRESISYNFEINVCGHPTIFENILIDHRYIIKSESRSKTHIKYIADFIYLLDHLNIIENVIKRY